MKAIVIIAAISMIGLSSFAQEPELSQREKQKLDKQLQKEQKEEESARKREIVKLMVEHGRFVLEADRLRDKRGNTAIVTPMLNFVLADSLNGVLQVGSNNYVGLNGVGGITVEGTISHYKYVQNEKNKTFFVSYSLMTPTGTYDVRMTVYPEGRADATISSSWPGQLNYSGYIVPQPLSRVYQGMTTY
jgi:hypothetical protein